MTLISNRTSPPLSVRLSLDYVRQTGVDAIRHEEMVLRLVDTQATIRRQDVMQVRKLTGDLRMSVERRGATYERVVP